MGREKNEGGFGVGDTALSQGDRARRGFSGLAERGE